MVYRNMHVKGEDEDSRSVERVPDQPVDTPCEEPLMTDPLNIAGDLLPLEESQELGDPEELSGIYHPEGTHSEYRSRRLKAVEHQSDRPRKDTEASVREPRDEDDSENRGQGTHAGEPQAVKTADRAGPECGDSHPLCRISNKK